MNTRAAPPTINGYDDIHIKWNKKMRNVCSLPLYDHTQRAFLIFEDYIEPLATCYVLYVGRRYYNLL